MLPGLVSRPKVNMKPNRAQWRKWVAAAKTLQNTNHPNMDHEYIVDQHPNVDLDQLIELPLNSVLPDDSDLDNSDPEIDEEQSEPSGDANGCSLHDEGDIGLIGNECRSESEDDLNDETRI